MPRRTVVVIVILAGEDGADKPVASSGAASAIAATKLRNVLAGFDM